MCPFLNDFTIIYFQECFNCICLVKRVHSPAKLRWFHLYISLGCRVPTSIVKNVKNHVQFPTKVRLAAHVPRAGHQTIPNSPAQSILSTLVLIPCRSDPWFQRYKPGTGPVFVTFRVFARISIISFPMLKQRGKRVFASRATRSLFTPPIPYIDQNRCPS